MEEQKRKRKKIPLLQREVAFVVEGKGEGGHGRRRG